MVKLPLIRAGNFRGRVRWSAELVAATKGQVKAEVDARRAVEGPEGVLAWLLAEIDAARERDDPEAHLRCFVLVVSTLLHDARFGGLNTTSGRQLAELAYGILSIHGIAPRKSRLATLYGDLHLALSNALRRRGQHWSAAWEQQMADWLSGTTRPGGEAFQQLAAGNRALRLGHGPMALACFQDAEAGGLPPREASLARLGRVIALRLAGCPGEARDLAMGTTFAPEAGEDATRELAWEAACAAATSTGDLDPIISLARQDPWKQAVFHAEALCWTMCAAKTSWREALPRRILRSTSASAANKAAQPFVKLVAVLVECDDVELPFAVRMKRVGEVIEEAETMVSIDKELLALGAAARWLARHNAYRHAALVLSQYRAISLRLSDGKSPDSLGLFGDLFERPWWGQRARAR